jgi:hypothetical protein
MGTLGEQWAAANSTVALATDIFWQLFIFDMTSLQSPYVLFLRSDLVFESDQL